MIKLSSVFNIGVFFGFLPNFGGFLLDNESKTEFFGLFGNFFAFWIGKRLRFTRFRAGKFPSFFIFTFLFAFFDTKAFDIESVL